MRAWTIRICFFKCRVPLLRVCACKRERATRERGCNHVCCLTSCVASLFRSLARARALSLSHSLTLAPSLWLSLPLTLSLSVCLSVCLSLISLSGSSLWGTCARKNSTSRECVFVLHQLACASKQECVCIASTRVCCHTVTCGPCRHTRAMRTYTYMCHKDAYLLCPQFVEERPVTSHALLGSEHIIERTNTRVGENSLVMTHNNNKRNKSWWQHNAWWQHDPVSCGENTIVGDKWC